MTEAQKFAIRCAYADLLGAYQAKSMGDIHAHDWDAHLQSVTDLEELFGDVVADLMPTE